jgi:predicted metal-dependent phosphoesterase TrpH
MDMEYMKRVGRTTFRADVTHNERGDWAISAGAFKATLPMTYQEADAWVEAGKPAEPAELPERIVKFLDSVARASGPLRKGERKRSRSYRERFAPLDGEERVNVHPIGKRVLGAGATTEVISGTVRCDSPRHDGGEALWFVIAHPGSNYDKAPHYCDGAGRIENTTPHEFAEQHRAWHREQYGVSARVELDRWIERNRNVGAPELSEDERREIDLGLAIAKSER